MNRPEKDLKTEDLYKGYFRERAGDFTVFKTINHTKFLFAQLNTVDHIINLQKYKFLPVLEIGSGIGGMSKLLMNYGFTNYIGLEVDKEAADFTNHTIGNFFINKSLDEFFKSTVMQYDLIIAFEVLEHMENPYKAIQTVYNMLGKGGIFVGTSPIPCKKNINADRSHYYLLHPENWRKLFIDSGFKKVFTRPMTTPPFLWRINKYINFVLPFYTSIRHFNSTSLIVAYK